MSLSAPFLTHGLTTRETTPLNLEAPFHALSGPLTPTGQFYVRSHFPAPALWRSSWRLEVGGQVHHPLSLTLDDLLALPQHTHTVTMECAGNGRMFLQPRPAGVAWELGAVGTAEWTGVRLADVLARAGLTAGATEVLLEGADEGCLEEPARTPGAIHYARSVPLDKALDDVLLVHSMNGEALTADHGAPVRAIVPGWYGMASVKWLSRLLVLDRPFQGYFQTVDYAYWHTEAGLPPQLVPLRQMQVKAQIQRPAPHERVPIASAYPVCGYAWSGTGAVSEVEVSADGGQSWQQAELAAADEAAPYAWRPWTWTWTTPPTPGPLTLLARARDSSGATQPAHHEPGRGKYMINFPLPVQVAVCESARQEAPANG